MGLRHTVLWIPSEQLSVALESGLRAPGSVAVAREVSGVVLVCDALVWTGAPAHHSLLVNRQGLGTQVRVGRVSLQGELSCWKSSLGAPVEDRFCY